MGLPSESKLALPVPLLIMVLRSAPSSRGFFVGVEKEGLWRYYWGMDNGVLMWVLMWLL